MEDFHTYPISEIKKEKVQYAIYAAFIKTLSRTLIFKIFLKLQGKIGWCSITKLMYALLCHSIVWRL